MLYPLALGWICFRQAYTLGLHKRELLALSRTDSLTGLLNHGAWKDQLDIAFQRCRRQQQGAAIALIDIDHFKSINDTYGHVAGDIVLRQLSKMLKQNLRAADIAGRYGGDEFCVILPTCRCSMRRRRWKPCANVSPRWVTSRTRRSRSA